jgi:LPXTG-site transpeptidase (sortase) family protein
VRRPDSRLTAAAVVLLAGAAAVGGLVVLRVDPSPQRDAATTPAAPAATTTAAPSPDEPRGFVPERVTIDALGVDAPVLALDRADDGTQEVPERLDATGWWQGGSEVGGPGSAAIVGHTSSTGGAVFDRLGDLEPGDRVRVDGDDGQEATFVVRRVETVPVAEFSRVAARVYARRGPSILALMTCGDYQGGAFRSTVIAWATPQRD